MLEALKERVYKENLKLVKYGLVLFTWGNVSGIDEDRKYIVIKPSGVEYELMQSEDMVVCDMEGNRIEGRYKPSSDLMTHLEIYKNFEKVGGIVHTHSRNATSFAQAQTDIPPLGTTHGDYFHGPIPCTRMMMPEEIANDYELNTGKVIVETFKSREIDYLDVPGCIVASHGPFVWGTSCEEAVYHSVVMEELAAMAINSKIINPFETTMQKELLDKHFYRKHGEGAYYGQ